MVIPVDRVYISYNINVTKIRVKLKDYLEARSVTPYQLGKELAARGGPNPKTVYNVVNGARRPDLETLEAILSALPALTNEPVALTDLLEVTEVEEPQLTVTTGPVAEGKLSITPSKGGKPKGLKGIVPKGGFVSDAVREERDERGDSL